VTSTHTDKRLVVLLAAGAVLLAGCGGGQSVTEQSAPTAASASTVSPSDMSNQQSPPDRLVIDVTINGGEVNPANQRLETKVKTPIIVRVKSDKADELHVHSTPEHTYKIVPNPDQQYQQFQFTVDVPGKVDIELHQLGTTIATVQVQP
jgi:hypothetical protein